MRATVSEAAKPFNRKARNDVTKDAKNFFVISARLCELCG